MNKYKNKIPKEDLKRFAKEIAKKLVASDFKAGRVKDPTKIDERQQKKVKEFCKQFFDKAYHKHKKHEQDRAVKKGHKGSRAKGEVTTESSTVASPAASPGQTNLSPTHDDDIDNIEMSDAEDMDATAIHVSVSPSSAQTPSERNGTLKRKRDGPEVGTIASPDGEEREPDTSPAKRINTSMEMDTPPPPPPPAPPIETPPTSTPRDGDGDTDIEMHALELPQDQTDIHADTNFRGRSMADVLAQAQQEDIDDDVDMAESIVGMEHGSMDTQSVSIR